MTKSGASSRKISRNSGLLTFSGWRNPDAQAFGGDLHCGRYCGPSPALGPVGLRDDADDRVAVPDEALKGRNSEVGCSHEENAWFCHGVNLLHEVDRIHIHLDLQAVARPFQDALRQDVQGAAVLPLEEDLPPEAAPDPGEGGFGGSDDLRFSTDRRGHLPCPGGSSGDHLFSFLLFQAGEMETHDTGEGGVVQLAAQREFIRVKAGIVVILSPEDRIVAGVEGLNEDPSRGIAPAASSGHLREDLEGPLGGPEIGDVEGGVGGDDADQRNPGEVVPFGDHLRSDEDVDPPPLETPENSRQLPAAGRRVAVHPGDPRLGEELLRLLLDPFRSRAVAPDAAPPAGGTKRCGPDVEIAVVAFEEPLGGMVREGQVAVRACEGVAAVGAEQVGVEAAPVEKKKGLFSGGQSLPDRLDQGTGEDGRPALLVPLRLQIDDLDRGKGPVVDS